MRTSDLIANPSLENWLGLIEAVLRHERIEEVERHGSVGFYLEQLVVLCEVRASSASFNRSVVNLAIGHAFDSLKSEYSIVDASPRERFYRICSLMDCDMRLGFFDRANRYAHRNELLSLSEHIPAWDERERDVLISTVSDYFLAYFFRLNSVKQDLETAYLVRQIAKEIGVVAPHYEAEVMALHFLVPPKRNLSEFVWKMVESPYWDAVLRYVLSYSMGMLATHPATVPLLRAAIRKYGAGARTVIEQSGFLLSYDLLSITSKTNSSHSISLIKLHGKINVDYIDQQMVAEWQSLYSQEFSLPTTFEEALL